VKELAASLSMALLLVGCAPAGYYGEVSPRHVPTADEQKEGSIGTIAFSIDDITIYGIRMVPYHVAANISIQRQKWFKSPGCVATNFAVSRC
jgi:hypothetical protein